MSGRLSSESPSPPRSSSSKRRPLHACSDSEINETPQYISRLTAADEQENGRSHPRLDDDKVYATSPFPTLESQILRPGEPNGGLAKSAAQPSSLETVTPSQHEASITITTPPVTIGNGSYLRSNETFLNDAVSPTIPFHSHGSSAAEADLTTPASTIRLVTEDAPSSQDREERPESISSSAQSPSHISSTPASFSTYSPDWPLPSISSSEAGPGTPTPAPRLTRPTIRAISTLNSDVTIRGTPHSARSANSSGTQIHRRGRGGDGSDEPPSGSYLNFADRRPRRSTLGSELLSSSPIVQRIGDSPTLNIPSSPPTGETFSVTGSPNDSESRFSFRRNSSGFPALRRYLEAAEATSRSPSLPSDQESPVGESSLGSRPDGRGPGNGGFRWSSLMSLSTSQTQPEGTTAPSSIRVISTEPSNLFDEVDTSQLTGNTTQSSVRAASVDPPQVFDEAETSALTENTNVQSSIRLVSPETSYLADEEDVSALTFQTQSSIRLVERSPQDTSVSRAHDRPVTEETPTNTRFHGIVAASSPVWISYSSPAQLPHIADESEYEEEVQTPAQGSPNLSQLSSSSNSDAPTSPNAQEVIFPSNSSHITRNSYRRRSIRQTSPFFHGSSGRAHLRQSTIGQLSQPKESDYWDPEQRTFQSATSSSVHNPLEPLSESHYPTTSAPRTPEPINESPAGSLSFDRPRASGILPFPAASSSVDNTPGSIHIPRNRPLDRSSRVQHIRARTLGSTSSNGSHGTNAVPAKSPRRSSSPVYPAGYPAPYTPRERPPRPSNPTPGVTPGTTPAQNRRIRPLYMPTLPDIDPTTDVTPISYPSVVHRASHYQLPGRVGHRDFSPHLWHGAAQAINRRSLFRPPSVDETQVQFLAGAKTRRDIQIACFALGFLVPLAWIVASFLPLPNRGNVDLIPIPGKKWKGKGVIGDPEKIGDFDIYSADEVAGFESARWWRGMNRCLSLLGLGLVVVLIVLGVITSKGGIQH